LFLFSKKKALLFEKLRIARGDRESKNFLSVWSEGLQPRWPKMAVPTRTWVAAWAMAVS
jgi:hypothetical protein